MRILLIFSLFSLASCYYSPQNHPIPTHTEAPTSQENNTGTAFFTTLEKLQTSEEAQAFFDTHRNKEQEIIIAILEQDCQGDAQCQHQKESARQEAMEQFFQEKSALEAHITHLHNTERAKKASQEDIKRAKSCLETSPLRTNPHTFIVWAFQNPHDTQCYYLGFIENNFFLISNSTPPHPLSHWDEFIGGYGNLLYESWYELGEFPASIPEYILRAHSLEHPPAFFVYEDIRETLQQVLKRHNISLPPYAYGRVQDRLPNRTMNEWYHFLKSSAPAPESVAAGVNILSLYDDLRNNSQ